MAKRPLTEREQRYYDRALRFRRKLLRLVADFPDDDDAQLYRDVAAECRTFADCIRDGVRPAPPMPSTQLMMKAEEFEAHCELKRFEQGQRAFGCTPDPRPPS